MLFLSPSLLFISLFLRGGVGLWCLYCVMSKDFLRSTIDFYFFGKEQIVLLIQKQYKNHIKLYKRKNRQLNESERNKVLMPPCSSKSIVSRKDFMFILVSFALFRFILYFVEL